MYTEHVYYSDVLVHHGIKGMKWGIRRYRNADGSLTAAGKKRQQKLYAEVDRTYTRQKRRTSNRIKRLDRKKYKLIQKDIMNKKVRDLKKTEIKNGLDYFERMYIRNGVLFGYGPGAIIAMTRSKTKFGVDSLRERNKISAEYYNKTKRRKK